MSLGFVLNAGAAEVDLALTKTADKTNVVEGDYVIFTVTVVNEGDFPASGTKIQDLIPLGMTLVGGLAVEGSYNGLSGEWVPQASGNPTPGELDQFEAATLVFYARVNSGTAGTSITNRASVVSVSPMDSNPTNDTAEAVVMVEARGAYLLVLKQ